MRWNYASLTVVLPRSTVAHLWDDCDLIAIRWSGLHHYGLEAKQRINSSSWKIFQVDMYIYIPITHPRPYEQKAYCFGWQVVLILTRKWTRAPCPVSLEWSLVAGWLQFVPKTPTCKKWFCAKQVWASQFFRKKNTLPGLFQQQSVPQNISKPIYLKNMGQLAFPRWHRLSWRETTPYLLAFFSPLVLGPLIPSCGSQPPCWVNHFMQITNLDERPFQVIFSTYKYFADLRTFRIIIDHFAKVQFYLLYILHSLVVGDAFICPCPPQKKCRATFCSDLKSLEEDLVHPARHSISKENIFSPRRKNKPTKLHHGAMSHICIRIYIYIYTCNQG